MSRRGLEWVLWPLLLSAGAGLAHVVLRLPPVDVGLSEQVLDHLETSGVQNPVTAVLLNFRGYDTLLEVTVLTLASIGIWSLAEMPRLPLAKPGLVLAFLVRVLVPFMVILGGHLLWVGSHAAGGAFQAGTVFAAAIVLMLLTDAPLPAGLGYWPLRLLMTLGLLTFVAIGIAMMVVEGRFLQFPPDRAKYLILVIEAAAAVSIAVILACAFRGGRPREPEA